MRNWLFNILPPSGIFGMDRDTATITILLIVSIIFMYVLGRILGIILPALFKRIRIRKLERQAEILKSHGVFKKASRLLAPLCFIMLIPFIFPKSDVGDEFYTITIKILFSYLYLTLWIFITGLVSAIGDIISIRNRKSIRGFTQIIQVAVSLIIVILLISMLLDKSPFNVLAGLGASAAVLMLVFKDVLLGFAASVQLSANKMLQVGDWITMPRNKADGTVIEIGLTAVKVRNWDNTIINIPTYDLVSDSYQNWRGMSESGGRRVKRHISIDMQSVVFCDDSMLERFAKINLISDYVAEKIGKIKASPATSTTSPALSERPTNLEIFRIYLERYLENNPDVILEMTHFVRQLQPTPTGIPLELYFFTTTDWIPYENVQSRVFEHVIASVPSFGLRIFQEESDKT